ncbi:hypothetical protein FAUST_2718 [Fusarium austroamericanum]|uniref:HNH nuclease domain-containing protein n=1 Tax=Fusarium austroamericanum TaxID=282268 RepID=A0AAN6HID9_FUSAU|nr:hypothetical protein FAUST_2718 [Fusarium austroamericanum]
MAEQYCPDAPTPGYLWDPILHVWRSPDSGQIKASHLFPSRQANFMNSIFGRDACEDLFSPCNGLFLYPLIEKALHCGYMAIVPDVELNDGLPWWYWHNISQSIEVCGWEKLEIKNYKYWRTYGRYAKRSQILGLIEHIQYDHAYELLNEGYDENNGIGETRPEAAEALLLEVIARSEDDGDDDFGTDKGDDYEESSEDDYEDDYDDYDEDVEDLPR